MVLELGRGGWVTKLEKSDKIYERSLRYELILIFTKTLQAALPYNNYKIENDACLIIIGAFLKSYYSHKWEGYIRVCEKGVKQEVGRGGQSQCVRKKYHI